jgi:NADP-dependent aldehyde dehydrogenase
MDGGIFSFVQGGSRAVGETLVTDPRIKAVGFTGSLGGGRALFDLCAKRPEPIPFFGELGSVNPMFVLPKAAAARGADLGTGWAASLTMGAGQFCTNPGIAIVVDGPEADAFVNAASEGLKAVAAQTMLTDGMADAYRDGARRVSEGAGVKSLLTSTCEGRSAAPYLFDVSAEDWMTNEELAEEVFGPLGLVIRVKDAEQMQAVAANFKGQLTTTLQMDDGDIDLARTLLPVLEQMAGRVLANGFPTGVEVADTMVHGGPYPASTNFGATSVGTLSIRRFLRPVCYQNLPEALLPADLRAD